MQSCWLAALLSWDDWFFTPLLARAYFMSYRKKRLNIFFMLYCCIAREQTMATICMWYREDASTNHRNICKLSIARSKNNDEPVFHVVLQWVSDNNYIFYITSRGSKQRYNITNIARSKELRYDKEKQKTNFYCCWSQEATRMSISLCCIAREQWQWYFLMLWEVVVSQACVRQQ